MSKFNIFVVEDNFLYSFTIESMIQELGEFNVTSYNSGEKCLEDLKTYNPDLIILDYHLSNGINGLETFKSIKEQKPKMKVIVLSNQTDVQVVADLLMLGAFDYIEKKDGAKSIEKLKEAVLKALK